MKIFVSWSGDASRQVAELLREWLPSVIQEVHPFVSSQDIEKGTRGLDRIGQNLEETDFGIICLTADNIAAPWINFEAGAISKRVASGHVIPILCGIDQIDVANSPLRQFQYSKVTEDEMRAAIASINASCDQPLSQERLFRSFERWWPEFLEAYGKIDFKTRNSTEPKDDSSRLGRIEEAIDVMMSDIKRMRREKRHETISAAALAKWGSDVNTARKSVFHIKPNIAPGTVIGKGLLGGMFEEEEEDDDGSVVSPPADTK